MARRNMERRFDQLQISPPQVPSLGFPEFVGRVLILMSMLHGRGHKSSPEELLVPGKSIHFEPSWILLISEHPGERSMLIL